MDGTLELLEPDADAPDGMMRNSYGGYSLANMIRAEHMLEDQLVRELARKAMVLSRAIADFREFAFESVDEFMVLLAERYGAVRGGSRGNTTLTSFDGRLRVQVSTGDFLTFGPELQIAKNLVDACLAEWSEGVNDNLRAIVNDAFDVGKEGKLRVDRILGLRRLQITDETWVRAMDAIGNAVRVTHSKRYLRFHVRLTHDGEWKQVPLDMARV